MACRVLKWMWLGLVVGMLAATTAYAQTAAPTETIRLSTTMTQEYGRIVFYGPVKDFDVRLAGNQLAISFGSAPLGSDLSTFTSQLGDLVASASARKNGIVLTLRNPDYVIRKFKEPDYAGVDLLFTQKRKTAEVPKATPPAKAEAPAKEKKTAAGKGKKDTTGKPASIIPPKLEDVAKGEKTPPTPKTPAKEKTKVPPPSVTPPPKDLAKTEKPPAGEKRIRLAPTKLEFPFKDAVAAAVYTQNGVTWVIFDQSFVADTDKIKATGGMISDAQQIQNRYYTVLKLTHPKENPSPRVTARRDDFNWTIDISDQPEVKPAHVPPVEPESKSLISLVFIPMLKTGEPLFTLNTQTGRKQVIVPIESGDTGMSPSRDFVDFLLPATHQGIVVEYKRDDILTKIVRDGIRITSQQGLNLFASRDDPGSIRARLAQKTKRAPEQAKSALPFDKDTTLERVLGESYAQRMSEIQHGKDESAKTLKIPDEDITPWRQELEQRVRNAKLEDKSALRLNLADFYFTEGLYVEALGELDFAEQEDPRLSANKEVRLRRAALDFLLQRYEEAEGILSTLGPEFLVKDARPEIELLRWANNQLIRPKSKQIREDLPFDILNHYDAFLEQYPPELRHKLGLLAANYWMDKEQPALAQQMADILKDDKLEPFAENRLKLVEARLAEHEGEVDKALEIYKGLRDNVDDREARGIAGYRAAMLSFERDLATPDETIKNLAALSYVWRGDDLELDILGMMGQLYTQVGNYLDGLRTWKTLVTNFPDTQEALYTAGKMKQIFINLFDEDRAFEVQPLQALAMFFEFRELTPVGEQGDRIVRKLVDYFIAADLLENAAAILTHQVRFRSSGEEQFRLALKLAGVHLQNHRPDLALEVLEFIPQEEIGEDLLKERKYLLARSLLEEDKYEEALRTIEGETSKVADDIRLDTLFRMRNWFGIMRIVEPRLQEIKEAPQHMKEHEADELVMLALAYANQQDRPRLLALRDNFLTDIPMRGKRQLFDYITNDPGKVDYRELKETVQIEDVGEFLTRNVFWPQKEWPSVARTLTPIVAKYEPSEDNPLTFEQKENILRLATSLALLEDGNSVKSLRELEKRFPALVFGGEFHHVFSNLTRVGDPIPIDAFNPPFTVKDIGTVIGKYKPFFEDNTLVNQELKPVPAAAGKTTPPPAAPPSPRQNS